jgi:hypothetical protein
MRRYLPAGRRDRYSRRRKLLNDRGVLAVSESTNSGTAARRAYKSPALSDFGALSTITLGNASSMDDTDMSMTLNAKGMDA